MLAKQHHVKLVFPHQTTRSNPKGCCGGRREYHGQRRQGCGLVIQPFSPPASVPGAKLHVGISPRVGANYGASLGHERSQDNERASSPRRFVGKQLRLQESNNCWLTWWIGNATEEGDTATCTATGAGDMETTVVMCGTWPLPTRYALFLGIAARAFGSTGPAGTASLFGFDVTVSVELLPLQRVRSCPRTVYLCSNSWH